MIVKLLTEHHLEFLSLNEAAEARPSLHLSKCQIVGNLMPRPKCCLSGLILEWFIWSGILNKTAEPKG